MIYLALIVGCGTEQSFKENYIDAKINGCETWLSQQTISSEPDENGFYLRTFKGAYGIPCQEELESARGKGHFLAIIDFSGVKIAQVKSIDLSFYSEHESLPVGDGKGVTRHFPFKHSKSNPQAIYAQPQNSINLPVDLKDDLLVEVTATVAPDHPIHNQIKLNLFLKEEIQ